MKIARYLAIAFALAIAYLLLNAAWNWLWVNLLLGEYLSPVDRSTVLLLH